MCKNLWQEAVSSQNATFFMLRKRLPPIYLPAKGAQERSLCWDDEISPDISERYCACERLNGGLLVNY
jgi:hypothetical protein